MQGLLLNFMEGSRGGDELHEGVFRAQSSLATENLSYKAIYDYYAIPDHQS